MKDWLKTKRRRGLSLLQVFFAVVISLVLCQFPLENLESFTYDLRTRHKPVSPVSGLIQTVTITPKTLELLSSFPDTEKYMDVFEKILAQNPIALISIVHPDDVPARNDQEKRIFAEKLEPMSSRLYFPGTSQDFYPKSLDHKLFLSAPFDKVKLSMGAPVKDINIFAKDQVSRRFILTYQDQETLHPQLARLITGYRGEFRGTFSFLATKQAYIDYRPKGTYPSTPFHDVLNGKIPKDLFANKVVIVGVDSETDNKYYLQTPHSREPLAMTQLEAQANMLDTLILDRAPIRLPDWSNKVITSVLSFFTLYVVMAFNPAVGLLTLVSAAVLFVLACYLLLAFAGIWVVMTHPAMALFICYYFSIPYRLIVENRRSWEYYQKHKLLQQVEELKTNFLSMMSHDIKTPIARIQGMTEILFSEKTRLSPQQTEAVRTIQGSAEELSGFISTILDLGRIENQKVQLKRQSKDINSLLEEVIEKHEFLAKNKNIQIIRELEPLFSIKIDVELMRQVFANLIENAIKYSPENSKVLVSTEEADGKIVIQVADQGRGIPPDEIDNVFMKFYRSKDVKSSNIKGSGLGLYLAKYFVDLHQGRIFIESTPGQGSTFTVELAEV